MVRLTKRSFNAPDERIDVPGILAEVVEIGGSTISRLVFQPGTHCPQISQEGKPFCLAHHNGYVIDGQLHVETQEGSVIDVEPNDVFDIPPGHDGWAIGPRPFVAVNWAGFRTWMPERAGERVLLTLLFTDVVGSTQRAAELGDRAWRDLLGQHYRAVRNMLDRYHGREVDTAGDGFLAVFNGAGRGISAAVAIRDGALSDGLSVRCGVHSGEVELVGEDVTGIAVHEAARIAAAAAPDEVLVSEATRLLAAGSGFTYESRGDFELKGLAGTRTLFAVSLA